jgi:hypothetical protein
MYGVSNFKAIELEVFVSSVTARQWYERLGFAEIGHTVWSFGVLPEARTSEVAHVEQYAQASRVHESFGFSEFTVQSHTGCYQVGRLGEDYYRISSPDALKDSALISCLGRLDPERRKLIVVAASDHRLPETFETIDQASRMRLALVSK